MGLRGFFWRLSDFMRSDQKKLFNIVAGRNGQLYEIRKETIGLMVSKTETIAELEDIPTGFRLDLPKIPSKFLLQILCFFRHYCNDWERNEVMVQIYWDTERKQYVVDCPYQWVNKARINATFNRSLEDGNRFIEVCHIHSHNTMPAEFSETDDENEKAFMIYAVIGRLHRKVPEMEVRVGYNGKFFRLPLDSIFENPRLDSPILVPFPTEWSRRVQVIQ